MVRFYLFYLRPVWPLFAATLLAGLAVPAVALTVGWRWAYGIGALLAQWLLARWHDAQLRRLAAAPKP